MRALVALLLLANLAFLALSQGWLQPWVGLSTQHEREPQRLAAQVDPAAVRIVPAATAAAAASAAVLASCLQAGPFDANQVEAAEAALADLPPGSWRRVAIEGSAPAYLLRVEAADASRQQQLAGLALPGSGTGFQPCPR